MEETAAFSKPVSASSDQSSVGETFGLWSINLLDGRMAFEDAWLNRLGYSESASHTTSDWWMGLIHPQDVAVVSADTELLRSGKISSMESEYRVETACGLWIWVLSRGRITDRDENGNPLVVIGTMLDVTERKRTEDLLLLQRDLGMALSGASELDHALHLCVDAAMQVSGMDIAGICLITPEGGLRSACIRGASAEFAAKVGYFGSDTIEVRLAGQQETLVSHEELSPSTQEAFREEGIRAAAMVPVVHEGVVVATFHIASKQFDAIPSSVLAGIEGIATLAGAAISRLRAEKALADSEIRYRRLVELLPDGVLVATDGVIRFANPSLARILREERPEDPIGRDVLSYVHPDEREASELRMKETLQTGGLARLADRRILCADGTEITVETTAHRIPVDDAVGLVVVVRDVTKRKQAEEELKAAKAELERHVAARTAELTAANERLKQEIIERKAVEDELRRSESRYRQMFRNNAAIKLLIDPETGSILEANKAAAAFYGYTVEELAQCTIDDLDASSGGLLKRYVNKVDETQQCTFACRSRLASGETREVELYFAPVKIAERKLLYTIAHDITQRIRYEEELQESEQRYKKLVDTMSEGLGIAGADGCINFANNRFAEMLGYEPDELVGVDRMKLIDATAQAEAAARFESRKQGKSDSYETILVAKNGQRVPCIVSSTPLFDNNGEFAGSFAVFTDIRERKHAEEERIRLVTAIEQCAEIIFVTDPQGNIQYVNPAFERATGYSRHEAIGRNPRMLKSGRQDEEFYRRLWGTITGGCVWSGRIANRRKDGGIFEEEATISPIRDQSGTIVNFVAVKRDVTNEVALENQLRQAQKMQAIGTLAGGIAHDFNNILYVILGYTELALNSVPPDSEIHSHLEQVLQASNRARELVRQILTFSRQVQKKRSPVSIAPIIKETVRFLRASIPSTIDIRQNVQSDLETVFADPTQLHQVLMNLCTNASHAMRETGGTMEVTAVNVHVEHPMSGLHDQVEPGRYVKLSVADTGPGVPPTIIDRIFDPYFSTKEPGEGTGLGLSVVHGIVKSYDGAVTVNSRSGKGAVFEVYLPSGGSSAVTFPRIVPELPTGTERVLIVDDEPAVVSLGRLVLEKLGYQVEVRTDGVEALELFRSAPRRFDVIVTDMTMPKMTGMDLAREVLAIRPDIPLILCTGFSELVDEDEALQLGVRAVISKPVSRKSMSETIRNVLEESRTGST